MSDHKSNRIDRRRRLLVTLGAGLAGAYVAPTLVNVARAEDRHHRGHHGYHRSSYSRPSGHHDHHYYEERHYYHDDYHHRRRHHDHHDSSMHFNILLHPSRW